MQKTITLTPSDNTLIGKYSFKCDTILVLLSSDTMAFSVSLPDLNSSEQHQFFFKNIGANSVTINTVNNQIIDYSGITSNVILSKQFYSIMSDSLEKWVSLESNVDVFGDETNNTTIEADGTQKANGDATTWEDIAFPLIIKTTGANRPTYATYTGTLESLRWAINDIAQALDGEIPHAHKTNSTMTWHVHFYTGVQNIDNRYVKWEIAYTGANYNSASAAETVISAEQMIPANTPINTHYILNIGTFTPVNEAPGFHIKARLKRITASGTAPSVNPFCELMQLHYEKDTDGSRTITTK